VAYFLGHPVGPRDVFIRAERRRRMCVTSNCSSRTAWASDL